MVATQRDEARRGMAKANLGEGPRVRHRGRTTAEVGLVIAGLGLWALVLEGSWRWAIIRIVSVTALTAGALIAVHRGRPLAAAGVAIIGGLVAIPIGGAILLPHAGAGSLTTRTVDGFWTMTGGVAALLGGLAMGCAVVHGWRRWAGGLALPLLAYAMCVPIAIAVAATNVPRRDLGASTPADHGLAYRTVTFPAADGVELAGWYIPSRNGAAVAVLHGASSTRSSVLPQAAVLARHGYGVLVFDARGTGLSAGRAMNLGWYGDQDVAGAVTFLAHQAEVDDGRIGALGESMGGEEAIGAMASDDRLRAVVAEGATSRVAGDLTWLSDEYGVRGWLQRGVNRLTYGLTDLLTEADPPISLRDAVSKAAPRPVLLITAGRVEEESVVAHLLRDASPRSVTVWEVPGSGHTHGLDTAPASWERRVTRFLDRSLLGPPPGEGP